jgi:hypothetical protein
LGGRVKRAFFAESAPAGIPDKQSLSLAQPHVSCDLLACPRPALVQPNLHRISHTPSEPSTALRGVASAAHSTESLQSLCVARGPCIATHNLRRTILEWLGRTGLLPTGSFHYHLSTIQSPFPCNALLSLSRMHSLPAIPSIRVGRTAIKSPKSSLNVASRGSPSST